MDEGRRFLDGLRRQHAKYRDMVAVAEEQLVVLESADVDALLKLLDRKRGIMAEIDAIEKEIADVKSRWPDIRPGLDASTIGEVESAVTETRAILERLVKLEEQGKTAMEKKKVATADELKGLWQKKKMRDAYGGGPPKKPPDTRFYDDKK